MLLRLTHLPPPPPPAAQVSPSQFVTVWRQLGVGLDLAMAAAFFAKYGQDARGMMPVLVSARLALPGQAPPTHPPTGVRCACWRSGNPQSPPAAPPSPPPPCTKQNHPPAHPITHAHPPARPPATYPPTRAPTRPLAHPPPAAYV